MGFNQAPALPYRNLGIVEDGDTASRAISKGKYVIWKGKNYFAKTDILQGETFVEDTNLTEIPDGALNGIADALNSNWILLKKFASSDLDKVVELNGKISDFKYLCLISDYSSFICSSTILPVELFTYSAITALNDGTLRKAQVYYTDDTHIRMNRLENLTYLYVYGIK